MEELLRLRARTARAELQAGALCGSALFEQLQGVPSRERDAWVDELLGLEAAPPDLEDLPRGAVPYLPCGVDEILTMVRELPLGPSDELVDLGSGLGKVVILAHLLAGARASGVELQAPLVQSARDRCVELGLRCISFVQANAADLELDGSVFFLYAPFNGDLLKAVLGRLANVAQRRSIAVCTVDLELQGVPWLRTRRTSNVALTLYDSRQT